MRSSKYNYIVPYKADMILVVNGVSKRFFSIDSNKRKAYEHMMNYPDSYSDDKYQVIVNKLISSGFIVADEYDEYEIIKTRYQKAINNGIYSLMILPTYHCNFDCWYCVQKHIEEYMSFETMERVKKHINNIVKTYPIKAIELSWFGGEPLLYFEECVKPISLYVQQVCMNNNLGFFNEITSNGYLLNPNITHQLKDIQLSNFNVSSKIYLSG